MFRSIFWYSVIFVILMYLVLEMIFPYVSMIMMAKENPLSIPSVLMFIYMTLILAGTFIYIASSLERRREFLHPIMTFLRGDYSLGIVMGRVRVATLILIPLFFGGFIFRQFVLEVKSPTGIRIQHPTMPGRFEAMNNPFRNPSDEVVKEFIQKEKLGNISLAEAKKALVQKYTQEGLVLYEKNCRPCHGVAAGGDGPMAQGLRLKPANFRDPGTIATVVEPFVFWRVNEGGRGLPKEGTPWDSAMPIWKNDLSEEEMWKIILAEYDIGEVEPRIPEKMGGE